MNEEVDPHICALSYSWDLCRYLSVILKSLYIEQMQITNDNDAGPCFHHNDHDVSVSVNSD